MATYNTIRKSKFDQGFADLSCDVCGSDDVIETREGYVCRSCGIVLKIQKLQYDRPYNEDIVQYAKGLGATQIGTRRERYISSNSSALNRLNKHNSSKDNEKAILERASIEISRLFTCLDFSDYNDIKQMVYDKFIIVREKLLSGSKFRNTNKLVAIITYLCLKLRAIPVNKSEIIKSSDLNKKDFNTFIMQVARYLPKATDKRRQSYISRQISDISQTFGLGMPFYYYAKKIMDKFWDEIKNTTDNVVAGLACSIAVLTSYKDKISVSSICNHLKIKMSTIQFQIKERVFTLFKVGDFTTLLKSADILRKIIIRLGLLDCEDFEQEPLEIADDDREEVILGNAQNIFNGKYTSDYFGFVFPEFDSLLTTILQSDEFLINPDLNEPCFSNVGFEFIYFKYHDSKGPPKLVR